MRTAMFLSALLALTGCQSTATGKSAAASIEGIEWRLIELNGQVISAQQTPLMVLEDGRLGGVTTCNNYFGQAQIDPHTITLTPMGVTEKYCHEGMETEQEMLTSFTLVTHWRLADNQLLLLNQDGIEIMRWQSPPAP